MTKAPFTMTDDPCMGRFWDADFRHFSCRIGNASETLMHFLPSDGSDVRIDFYPTTPTGERLCPMGFIRVETVRGLHSAMALAMTMGDRLDRNCEELQRTAVGFIQRVCDNSASWVNSDDQ